MAERPASSALDDTPRYHTILTTWLTLVVLLHGVLWITGFRTLSLAESVEEGTARVERQAISEGREDQTREVIQTQRDTLPFWTAIALIDDFAIEPLALVARALAVAISFSALAAVVGRQVRFQLAFAQSMLLQGIWVAGLAVQVVLTLVLWRPQVETSVLLVLPSGKYDALYWLLLRQLDWFALVGWMTLAWSAWRRKQANLWMAVLTCLILAVGEAAIRVQVGLTLERFMRLSMITD